MIKYCIFVVGINDRLIITKVIIFYYSMPPVNNFVRSTSFFE